MFNTDTAHVLGFVPIAVHVWLFQGVCAGKPHAILQSGLFAGYPVSGRPQEGPYVLGGYVCALFVLVSSYSVFGHFYLTAPSGCHTLRGCLFVCHRAYRFGLTYIGWQGSGWAGGSH
jgi:hypothetical protein